MIYATVRQFLLWAPYKNYFMYAWMYVFCCVQLLLIGTEYVLQCVRVTGHEIETFSTCVAGVVDFFTSIQMECGELSRDSHISALVLSIRTALSRLRSLAWLPSRGLQKCSNINGIIFYVLVYACRRMACIEVSNRIRCEAAWGCYGNHCALIQPQLRTASTAVGLVSVVELLYTNVPVFVCFCV